MSSEPQRDIEKNLLAYKQLRLEQAGPPPELHPATRRMLQGEAARTANRPLLTSEEAAKNFVRSFAMSHQQPSFFARQRQRIIWGSAMCACLALVFAVLRNDPQQTAQQHAFPDALPTATPPSAPQPIQRQPTSITANPKAEAEKSQDVAKKLSAPASGPMTDTPRGAIVASAPTRTEPREPDRRSGATTEPLQPNSTFGSGAGGGGASPTVSNRTVAKTDNAKRPIPEDRKQAEKIEVGQSAQTKSDKERAVTATALEPSPQKASAVMKLKRVASDELSLKPVASVSGGTSRPVSAPAPESASLKLNDYYAASQMMQRFQQVDDRARYRQNPNSPPIPQVMQDFAFERTGDRVQIVDADGSTYQGNVTPSPADATRAKGVAKLAASRESKATGDGSQQAGRAPVPEAQAAYFFYANGVNRKLNQSVEFRGEWHPSTPTQSGTSIPALLPASFGVVQSESLVAERKDKAATNTLAEKLAPAQINQLNYQQQKESSPGQISGRAVVGGKNEFDIKAVPK